MFCSYCGAQNPDDGRFCSVCGRGLSSVPSSHCGVRTVETPASGAASEFSAATELGLQSDTVLIDRYLIRRELGMGGMGRVYLAEDQILGTHVAIKVLRDLLSRDPGAVQRLKKEAKLAMQLSHPNIVRVHTYQEAEFVKFLAMEYVEGETLAHRAAREGCLQEDEARRIAIAICSGLEHAHEKRIIHRDLKPGNVLCGKDGSIKIADFGIARVCRDSMSRLTSQLDSGTLIYMSPEQLMGESSELSDLYSMGTILYELLSGEVPFHSGDIQAQIRWKAPAPLAGVSAGMNEIVMRCLDKAPEARLACIRELRERLEGKRAAVAHAVGISPPEPVVPAPEERRPLQDPSSGVPPVRESDRPPAPSAAVPPEIAYGAPPFPGDERSSLPERPKSSRWLASAIRGALGFGLGSIVACFPVNLYLWGEVGSDFLMLLAIPTFVCWGLIGAVALKMGRKGGIGLALGFAVAGVLCMGQVSTGRDEETLIVTLACGLLLAGLIGAAYMRRGIRWVIAAGVAWAVLPPLVGGLFLLGYELFARQEEPALLFGAVFGTALTGALFGAAYARWGTETESGGPTNTRKTGE